MTKNILILAYQFPPFGGTGAVRMASLAKYLPELSWHPHVITGDWNADNCRQFDAGFGEHLEQFVKHRTKIIGGTQVAPPAKPPGKLVGKIRRYNQLQQELRNWFRWYRQGQQQVRTLMEAQNFDLMLATYPPGPAHWLASWTAKKYNLPWIADFRDIIEEQFNGWKLKRFKRIEKERLLTSSGITTVSKPLCAQLESRHARTVTFLPNGFDPSEIEKRLPSRPERNPLFNILYTGVIYPYGAAARLSPSILFEALDILAKSGKVSLDDFELEFIGTTEAKLKSHFKGFESEGRVKTNQWMSRNEIYKKQAASTVLLSLGSKEMPGIITGKIFEYLYSRRPVISVPKDKDAISDLLEKSQAGYSASSPEELSEILLRLYTQWKVDKIPDLPPNQELQNYEWKGLAKQFVQLADSIIG